MPVTVYTKDEVDALIASVRTPAPTPTPTPTPTPAPLKGFGFAAPELVYQTGSVQDAWLSDMKALGMTWVRFDINWAMVQATQATYDWSTYDSLLTKCSANGIKVLGTPYITPAWARPSGTNDKCPPTDLNAYATFVKAAVQHFGNAVAAYEIWNEPNISTFWQPTPNVAAYTQLLKLAAAAMRSVNPSVVIITAGLSPVDTGGGNLHPIDFIKGIYANGGKDSCTAISHHPYCYPVLPTEFATYSAWSYMSQTTPTSIRSVMADNGDASKPLWITEMGAPTSGPPTDPVRTCSMPLGAWAIYDQCMQARYLQQVVSVSKTLTWVGPVFIYTYKDRGTNTADRENFFGVVDFNGVRKQAYGQLGV